MHNPSHAIAARLVCQPPATTSFRYWGVRQPAMLARAMKMAFWVTYDHLGKLIVASLLWALPVGVCLFFSVTALLTRDPLIALTIGLPASVIGLGVALPVLTAGLCHMAKILIDTRDGSVSDMFRGIYLYWRAALALGLLYLIAATCLATSVWFYASKLRDTAPWLGYAISGLSLWGLIFVVLTGILVIPTLVQKRDGVWGTVRLTALIVLDNPLFVLGVALQLAGVTVLAGVITPVFFFIYGGLVCVLVTLSLIHI